MLKNLILPLSIYRIRVKIHAIESRITKMESNRYLDLQGRIEVSQMRKMIANLHEQETALHFSLSL